MGEENLIDSKFVHFTRQRLAAIDNKTGRPIKLAQF